MFVVIFDCFFLCSSCYFLCCSFFFFFKQKTAYEMRISDWSSDVCSADLYPLDLMRTAAGLQLFFLRAQHHNALIGDTIEVDVSLSMPTGEAREARAYVDCRLAGDKSADCGKQQALEEYYAAVQAYWSRLCRADLGCWALESGISEFRMSARVLVDPRKALSAIGLSRPAA